MGGMGTPLWTLDLQAILKPIFKAKMPNLKLGDTVPNFSADTTEGKIDFHEWIGDSWPFCSVTLLIILQCAPLNWEGCKNWLASSKNEESSWLHCLAIVLKVIKDGSKTSRPTTSWTPSPTQSLPIRTVALPIPTA